MVKKIATVIAIVIILIMLALAGLGVVKRHFLNLHELSTQKNSYHLASGGDQSGNPKDEAGSDLAACQGTEVFSISPATPETYDYIEPLGHTSSYNGNAGHVFPSDHLYIALHHSRPEDPQSSTLPTTVVAPGNGEITKITDTRYEENGKVTHHDYRIYFSPCNGVEARLDHINTLSQTLQTTMSNSAKICQSSYTTGGPNSPTYIPCDYNLNLKLKAGDLVGTTGGPDIQAANEFDFGVYDWRNKPLPFLNSKQVADDQYAVCGLSYYPYGEVKTALYNSLKTTKVDTNGQKDCGTNMWDKTGTIQGNWMLSEAPDNSRVSGGGQNALSIIHYDMDPSRGNIDWGGVISPANHITFPIKAVGNINRDPADVTADGKIYCFEGSSFSKSDLHTLLIQLADSNTLKIEHKNGNTCSANPSFSAPTSYAR